MRENANEGNRMNNKYVMKQIIKGCKAESILGKQQGTYIITTSQTSGSLSIL